MIRVDEIPIYIGLLAIVVLVFDTKIKLHAAWLWCAAPILAFGAILPHLLIRLGSENYNLVEMLRQDRLLPGVRLAVICLLAPFAATCATSTWMSGSRLRSACWIPASCLVTWGILRRAVTVESVQDILGAPVLHWPADLEYMIRLSAVYVSFVWLPIFFTLMACQSRRWLVGAIAYSTALMAASAVIVNGYTQSDNVPELFREFGHLWFAATCLLAPWAAVLCDRAYRGFGPLAAGTTMVLLSVLASTMLDRAILLSDIHGLQIGFLVTAVAFATAVICILPAVRSNTLGGMVDCRKFDFGFHNPYHR